MAIEGNFDLKNNWHTDIPLVDLKQWIEEQIAKGNTHFSLELEYDYYGGVADMELEAKQKTTS